MKNYSEKDINSILKDVFPAADIPEECKNLKIGDFDEWDSLGNFNFLLSIEEFYDIRFSVEDISEIQSVEQVRIFIEALNE